MSALPAEKNEAKKLEYVLYTKWITLEEARALYGEHKFQMKAPYFQEPEEEPLPKIDTIDEMATKLLKAVQGLGC